MRSSRRARNGAIQSHRGGRSRTARAEYWRGGPAGRGTCGTNGPDANCPQNNRADRRPQGAPIMLTLGRRPSFAARVDTARLLFDR